MATPCRLSNPNLLSHERPEPPGSSSQPEARWSSRVCATSSACPTPRHGESLRETIDEMIEEPVADDPRPTERTERC